MVWRNDQVSEAETEKILGIAHEALNLEGDYVELGCYKGDTSLLLAEVLVNSNKRLWIYDSFEGLPEKGEADLSVVGEDFKAGELFVTKREVKERFLRANLPVPVIKKAWFNELSAEDLPSVVALAFLDGDFYESIVDSLKLVWARMADGGKIIVHDYGSSALPGVAKAVDEWLVGSGAKQSARQFQTEKYQSLLIISF